MDSMVAGLIIASGASGLFLYWLGRRRDSVVFQILAPFMQGFVILGIVLSIQDMRGVDVALQALIVMAIISVTVVPLLHWVITKIGDST